MTRVISLANGAGHVTSLGFSGFFGSKTGLIVDASTAVVSEDSS